MSYGLSDELRDRGTCSAKECAARQQIVRDIIKAKRDAGFPLTSVFFKDVWPVVLAAYLKSKEKP